MRRVSWWGLIRAPLTIIRSIQLIPCLRRKWAEGETGGGERVRCRLWAHQLPALQPSPDAELCRRSRANQGALPWCSSDRRAPSAPAITDKMIPVRHYSYNEQRIIVFVYKSYDHNTDPSTVKLWSLLWCDFSFPVRRALAWWIAGPDSLYSHSWFLYPRASPTPLSNMAAL